MTTRKQATAKAEKDLAEMAKGVSTESLIDWLAQLAYDAEYDWGWIRDELMARIPERKRRTR